MNNRPHIEISASPLDKIVEVLSIIAIVAMWAISIWHYGNLPEEIPIHFNLSGEVDRHAAKYMVFLLPLLGTFLYGFLTVLYKNPRSFNYPVEITEENAEFQYKNAVRLMRFVNFSVVFLFAILTFKIIEVAIGQADRLNPEFLLMILAIIFLPIIYFLVRSVRNA